MRGRQTYSLEEDKRLDAEGYSKARPLLDLVKKSKELSYNQKRMIWDKTIHGDIDAARKMYESILTGELYPCQGDIFEETYELVEEG